MLRPAIVASLSTAVAAVLLAVPAAAAGPAPSPPPGSVNVQPAGATTDGQPGAYHCGVAAGAGGNGYVVQPQQITTSGASSPTGCGASTPSGAGAGATQPGSTSQTTSSGAGAQARPAAAGQTSGGDLVPGASAHGAGGFFGGPLWLGLLLFLALFLLLIGFALGRRRPARATA